MSLKQSQLLNPGLTVLLFGVVLDKLGGTVRITQADIDKIAYTKMSEEGFEDGTLEFKLEIPTMESMS